MRKVNDIPRTWALVQLMIRPKITCPINGRKETMRNTTFVCEVPLEGCNNAAPTDTKSYTVMHNPTSATTLLAYFRSISSISARS